MYPHDGSDETSQKSLDRDVAYCACSSIPACSINFPSKHGFFRDDDDASFSLKCAPRFFKERKCANFLLDAGLGEPVGDGGISRFKYGGKVKSRTKVRVVENGDALGGSSASVNAVRGGCNGPTIGWSVPAEELGAHCRL